jgi:short-subunit dehydrogenase
VTAGTKRRGETALLTGASAGIGRELAGIFAENGFDLIAVARSEDKLALLAEECREAHGTRVTVLPMDLLQPEAPQSLRRAVEERGLRVDVLVNNAGVLELGAFREIDHARHQALLHLNVSTLTALTHLFVGDMVDRGRGRILNVASLAAFQPVPSLALYAASKAFALSLSESLSEELRGTGVTVTALCPSFTRTAMVDRVQETNEAARQIPDFLISDVEQVAREGYAGCMEGRVVVVPGLGNRLGAGVVHLYPRWLVRTVGGLLGRRAL